MSSSREGLEMHLAGDRLFKEELQGSSWLEEITWLVQSQFFYSVNSYQLCNLNN